MGRPPCCDKSNVKRGLWTPEEDAKILAHVSKHGTGNWTLVPQKAGLNRCGKSCRLRWTNYLRPDLNHDDFTPQEEEHIINLHQAIGSRWSLIAKQLPGRTDNDVKNYWNTKLRKKLSKMGIDPVTHKPISQLLSEFGNISGLPSPGHHVVVPRMETSSAITGLPSSDMIARLAKEQFQDCNSFSAMEFLSQLQVTNQDIIQPHFFNEVTSSSSSTSSSLVTADLASPRESYSRQQPQAQPLAPSPSLNWSEFLLREPYQHSDVAQQEQEDDFQGVLSSRSPVVSSQSEISVQKPANGSEFCSLNAGDLGSTVLGVQMNNQLENSSANSFVDNILDRDTELRSAFPEFLDGSLEYYLVDLNDTFPLIL